MFCATYNIPKNIPHIWTGYEEDSMKYCRSHETLLRGVMKDSKLYVRAVSVRANLY